MKLGETFAIFGFLAACLPMALGYCGTYCSYCSFGFCYSCYSGYYYSSTYSDCIAYGSTTLDFSVAVNFPYYNIIAIVVPIVFFIMIILICYCLARRRRMQNRINANSDAKLVEAGSSQSHNPIVDQTPSMNEPIKNPDYEIAKQHQVIHSTPYSDPYAMQPQPQPVFVNQSQPMYMNQQPQPVFVNQSQPMYMNQQPQPIFIDPQPQPVFINQQQPIYGAYGY